MGMHSRSNGSIDIIDDFGRSKLFSRNIDKVTIQPRLEDCARQPNERFLAKLGIP
jgi:hypothetical protein